MESNAATLAACAVEVLRCADKLACRTDPTAADWLAVESIGLACQRFLGAKFSRERDAAAGIDGVTWRTYGENLEANLLDLSARLERGAYRASSVRRVYIAKADGQPRPLGVPTLEDKLVQRAVVEVLNAIYEVEFLGFSYGFRPGRGPHDALDALAKAIMSKKVSWVLDADIRGFLAPQQNLWADRA
jgi:retron-type reverse transcriptase